MFSASDLVYLKYPNYVPLRCCSIIPKLSLVSVIVCTCVHVVLLGPRRVIVVILTTQAKSR